jgi:hypothetical protein
MDERTFFFEKGQPIPSWDFRHRLPIISPVGPDCKDTWATFKINSIYMDITDQTYLIRQWQAFGILIAIMGMGIGFWTFYLTRILYSGRGNLFFDLMALFIIFIFGYRAFKYGRDEFFSLKRRPIRLHRKLKKIYSIRRRKFFQKPGEGDTIKEISWNENAIFCIHKGRTNSGYTYHIRYYEIDKDNNVTFAFALGREWVGKESIEDLLSQWNFWCTYMRQGPEHIPKPALYFSENETPLESFLMCMYDFGGTASAAARIIVMPFILMNTVFRLLSLSTCRDPIWPASVEQVSIIDEDDPYEQPRGDTPIGWGPTTLARGRGEYPIDPKKIMSEWRGQKNPKENAALWARDIPPGVTQTGATQ